MRSAAKKRDARWVALERQRYRRELDRHDAASFPANDRIARRGPIRASYPEAPSGKGTYFYSWPSWAADRPPWWETRPNAAERRYLRRGRRRDDQWSKRYRAAEKAGRSVAGRH
jgi:hypothetical protein